MAFVSLTCSESVEIWKLLMSPSLTHSVKIDLLAGSFREN